MPLLEVRNLQVHYGKIHAMRGVSLSLGKDQIVTLIGANGAGKSTTLRAISGILAMTGGDVVLEGELAQGAAGAPHRRQGHRPGAGGRRIFGRLTVAENLRLGAFLHADKRRIAAMEARALDLFPALKERLTQVAGTLSGGEQQMLAIARGLMANPRVLLLDEPSMGLAPILVQKIFETIVEIRKQGVPVLLVEQNAFLSLQIADYGYVIETGEVVLEGPAPSCSPILRSRRPILAETGASRWGKRRRRPASVAIAVPGLATDGLAFQPCRDGRHLCVPVGDRRERRSGRGRGAWRYRARDRDRDDRHW